MQAIERASWQNPKVLTTLVLVFITGAFAGAISMRFGLHQRLHQPTSSSWRDPHAYERFLDNCKKQLNLSPKQAEQMQVILDDYKQYYQSLQDQLDDVRGTGKSRILNILDEQQRQKFEKMMNEVPR